MSFEQQLMCLVRGDIFIGPMGSGFINMIFMVPNSVVLSVMPPYKYGPFFQTLSYFTRINYISIFNTTAQVPEHCKEYYTYYGQIRKNITCHWDIYNSNLYIPPGVLYQNLIIAQEYIEKQKYHTII